MKNLSTAQFQRLPSAFQESIIERSKISTYVGNLKMFIKDVKDTDKWAKDHEEYEAIMNGRLHTLNHYYENNLPEVERLANKYHELWREKFYKVKLQAEYLLNI